MFGQIQQSEAKIQNNQRTESSDGEIRRYQIKYNKSETKIITLWKGSLFFLSDFRYDWVFQNNEDKLCTVTKKYNCQSRLKIVYQKRFKKWAVESR